MKKSSNLPVEFSANVSPLIFKEHLQETILNIRSVDKTKSNVRSWRMMNLLLIVIQRTCCTCKTDSLLGCTLNFNYDICSWQWINRKKKEGHLTCARSVPRTMSCAPRLNRNVVPLSIVTVDPYGITKSPGASYGLCERESRILPLRFGRTVAWYKQNESTMITSCNDAMHYLDYGFECTRILFSLLN